MTWIDAMGPFEPRDRARLEALLPMPVPRGTVLFRPGDPAQGFVVILSGRVEVFLTGPTGREILLYAVEPGQSCVQTTLSLIGDEVYAGEAIAATDCRIVVIPKPLFLRLLNESAAFRQFVFAAFAARMQDMTALLERVAFQRIEIRLAAALLAAASGDRVAATQSDLAARIGTAREVVSRQLDSFAKRGWVQTERGSIRLFNLPELRRIAMADAPAHPARG